MLVVNDTEYGARIPILLGTLHINMILDKATLEEIQNLPAAWRRGSIGSMVLCREAVARYVVPDHEHQGPSQVE